MHNHSIVAVLLEHVLVICVLSAVANGSHHQQLDGILSSPTLKAPSSESRRQGSYLNPAFILTSKSRPTSSLVELLRSKVDLSQIRGGSIDDDEIDTDAVVVDADVTTSASANITTDIDIIDAEAEESSSLQVNTTVDDQTQEELPSNLTFAATKPHDGSLEDPDGIPTRFLLMKKNDRAGAKVAFEGTLAWRKQLEVDTILSRPHPKYDVCKAIVPHYFSGRDPNNNIILVQRPAILDFELMEKNNATIDDLLMHYIYIIEYCWNILEPGPPERVMTNVLDMRGMSFKIIRNQEYIGFGKRFVQMMSENYPGRSYKTLVINAPTWFHALYKIFKPLLRESTRQKIVILKAGGKQDAALKFFLGDSLPRDLISETEEDATKKERPYGSRYFLPVENREDCEPGPNSLLEFDMRQHVSVLLVLCTNFLFFVLNLRVRYEPDSFWQCIAQLKLHNMTMQEVVG